MCSQSERQVTYCESERVLRVLRKACPTRYSFIDALATALVSLFRARVTLNLPFEMQSVGVQGIDVILPNSGADGMGSGTKRLGDRVCRFITNFLSPVL